jgi:hypothetical protein
MGSRWAEVSMSATGAERSSSGKVVAAVVAILIGAGGVWYFTSQQDKENAETSCHLAAAGVTALAAGLSHGRNTQEIIALSSGAISDVACRDVVESMIESPSRPVTVVVQTGNGETPLQLSRTQLTPPISGVSTCNDWLSPTLKQMCMDGRLAPPVWTP